MTIGSMLSILVGILGIATVLFLVLLFLISDSSKGLDKASYSKKVKPYFYAFLVTFSIFSIGFLLSVDLVMIPGFIISLSIVVIAGVLQYRRPYGLTNLHLKHVPNWKAGVIIGIVMMIVGALIIIVTYPMGLMPMDTLRIIPLTVAGLGMLLIFISAVSFRTMSDHNDRSL